LSHSNCRIKAIESATKDDDTQWLTYWVIFALFNVAEFASDTIVGWFPIYWLLKVSHSDLVPGQASLYLQCAFMVYLWLPSTRGATYLYMKFVRPFVAKHGTTIDKRIASVIGTVGDGWLTVLFIYTQTFAAVKENVDHLRQD
jgi:receptor expression-enhancing protein 5/6